MFAISIEMGNREFSKKQETNDEARLFNVTLSPIYRRLKSVRGAMKLFIH